MIFKTRKTSIAVGVQRIKVFIRAGSWQCECLRGVLPFLICALLSFFLPVGGNRTESFSWVLAGFLSFLPQKNNPKKPSGEVWSMQLKDCYSAVGLEYFQSDGQIMVLSSYKARVLEGGVGNPGSPVNLAGHPLWVFFFFFPFLTTRPFLRLLSPVLKTLYLLSNCVWWCFFQELHFWN